MKRVYVGLSDELAKKIDYWADRMEIANSALITLSIQAGLGSILKATFPEEAIPPEIIADIIKAVDAKGGLISEKGTGADVEASRRSGPK